MEYTEKKHKHEHQHEHGKPPVVLYVTGLILFVIGLFLSDESILIKNILFSITLLSAGYHVIILEGIGETIENTKTNKNLPLTLTY